MARMRGLFILDRSAFDLVYSSSHLAAIKQHVDFPANPVTREMIFRNPAVLRDVDVIFSGWGMPRVDQEFLDAAPRLRAVFYAGGAIGSWMTQAAWDRGLIVTTAAQANAVPVAEYALSTILYSLKHGWSLSRRVHAERSFPPRDGAPGAYETSVGLISLGAIARKLVTLLEPFDLHVVAYDPFVSVREAEGLGIELVSLDELFRRCDVVSLHTPELPETRGMITGRHIASMKHGATFINTARGAVVREQEMLAVLGQRADLQAVLDTVMEEPPAPDSLLYALPNVVLTPHIAGSVGRECQRMARYMVEELERYVRDEPLRWEVTAEAAARSSHRPVLNGDVAVSVSINPDVHPLRIRVPQAGAVGAER